MAANTTTEDLIEALALWSAEASAVRGGDELRLRRARNESSSSVSLRQQKRPGQSPRERLTEILEEARAYVRQLRDEPTVDLSEESEARRYQEYAAINRAQADALEQAIARAQEVAAES